MLTLGGPGNAKQNLQDLHILPVSISYEFDPNDYLKVREFLMKRRDPEFKKSQHVDLCSMVTGILQFKGHVHFSIIEPINTKLATGGGSDRNSVVPFARVIIDNEIQAGYKIFPINYISYDRLNHTDRFADCYTEADVREVDAYFERQEASVDVADLSADEREFVREMFLKMYANPLINKLAAN